MRRAAFAVWLAGCSFQASSSEVAPPDAGGVDARAPSDAPHAMADAPPTMPDAPAMMPDAPTPTNVIAAANGGVIASFSSQYCSGSAYDPSDCRPGYWNASNIDDGSDAIGNGSDAFRAAWSSSERNGSSPPEYFVFSFAQPTATIEYVVVQNWGGGGESDYHSSHFQLYGSTDKGATWSMYLDDDLAIDDTPQMFALPAPETVDELKFVITDGVTPEYLELGELEAWGY